MGDLSPHFNRREFGCRHCGAALIHDQLVWKLEHLRSIVGRPLIVVSGYRCAVHNRAVGGAGGSQHMLGTAADLQAGYATVSQAVAAGFVGIGRRGGWAVHVDVRPKPAARWVYS